MKPTLKPAPAHRARILDPNFVYVPAAATDVQATWRRFGWRPTSEGNAK